MVRLSRCQRVDLCRVSFLNHMKCQERFNVPMCGVVIVTKVGSGESRSMKCFDLLFSSGRMDL